MSIVCSPELLQTVDGPDEALVLAVLPLLVKTRTPGQGHALAALLVQGLTRRTVTAGHALGLARVTSGRVLARA